MRAKAVKGFGMFLGRSFLHAAANIKLKAKVPGDMAEAELNFAALRDIYDEYGKAAHPEKAYLNEFESSLGSWIKETITAGGERMVIFIDDLDRCLPDVALQVLEALKLYLNIEDLIFVVGVDRQVIDELVRKHYVDIGLSPEKSSHYLEKMFQIEVTVAPTDRQIETFLDEQLEAIGKHTKQYWKKKLTGDKPDIFRNVILSMAWNSPREVLGYHRIRRPKRTTVGCRNLICPDRKSRT